MTMSTTDESVHVRPLRAEDAAWVQPLYAANSRDALTPEQVGQLSDICSAVLDRLDPEGHLTMKAAEAPH